MPKTKLPIVINTELLKIYFPKQTQFLYKKITTVEQAIATKSHSIANLKKQFGENKMESLIKIYLIDLNELINLKRPLTEPQIDRIASEVITNYINLTMVDIHLIFYRAITGYYGDFYESINIAKVLKWFRDYLNERCNEFYEQGLNEHAKYSGSPHDRALAPLSSIATKIDNFKKMLKMNKTKKND